MTKEDLISCIKRQEHRGVPTFLLDGCIGARYAGIDVSEIFQYGFDSELSAKSISSSRRQLGHDGIVGSLMFADYASLGEECEYPSNGMPVITKHAFEDPMDMEYCSAYDIIETNVMDECIRSYELVRGYEPDAAMAAIFPSVLDVAARIRGKEAFLMDMNCDEYAFDETVGFAKGIVNLVSDRILEEGDPDFVILTCTMDDMNLIGEERFMDSSILDMTNTYYKCVGSGKPAVIHPSCILTDDLGKKMLKPMRYVGFEGLYYSGGNDHNAMVQLCQNDISLVGGVDIHTICHGTDDAVRDEVEEVMNIMDGSNFVYTCSDSVDVSADTHLLEAMMSAVKAHQLQ